MEDFLQCKSLYVSQNIKHLLSQRLTKGREFSIFLTVNTVGAYLFSTMAIQIYVVILMLFLYSDTDILQWRNGSPCLAPWISVELYKFFDCQNVIEVMLHYFVILEARLLKAMLLDFMVALGTHPPAWEETSVTWRGHIQVFLLTTQTGLSRHPSIKCKIREQMSLQVRDNFSIHVFQLRSQTQGRDHLYST